MWQKHIFISITIAIFFLQSGNLNAQISDTAILKTAFSNTNIGNSIFENENIAYLPESYKMLKNFSKVTSLLVFEINQNGKRTTLADNTYCDGLVLTADSSYNMETDLYEYDSYNRVTKRGSLTWEYPETVYNTAVKEITRVVNYMGGFRQTESVILTDDGYQAFTIGTSGGDEYVSSTKYIFEKGLLKRMTELSLVAYRGETELKEWNWYDFEYQNGLLTRIVNTTSTKDNIRSIRTVTEYNTRLV